MLLDSPPLVACFVVCVVVETATIGLTWLDVLLLFFEAWADTWAVLLTKPFFLSAPAKLGTFGVLKTMVDYWLSLWFWTLAVW